MEKEKSYEAREQLNVAQREGSKRKLESGERMREK